MAGEESIRLIDRDDARPAQAQVVLKCDPRTLDLSLLCIATQLLCQLVALREPGRTQWMSF